MRMLKANTSNVSDNVFCLPKVLKIWIRAKTRAKMLLQNIEAHPKLVGCPFFQLLKVLYAWQRSVLNVSNTFWMHRIERDCISIAMRWKFAFCHHILPTFRARCLPILSRVDYMHIKSKFFQIFRKWNIKNVPNSWKYLFMAKMKKLSHAHTHSSSRYEPYVNKHALLLVYIVKSKWSKKKPRVPIGGRSTLYNSCLPI